MTAAYSSCSRPATSLGAITLKPCSDAKMQRIIKEGLEARMKIEKEAKQIAFLFVELNFIHVDASQKDSMKQKFADYLGSPSVSELIHYKILGPKDVKISIDEGGFAKILEFINVNKEIQYCQFTAAAVSRFLEGDSREEFSQFTGHLQRNRLLRM